MYFGSLFELEDGAKVEISDNSDPKIKKYSVLYTHFLRKATP